MKKKKVKFTTQTAIIVMVLIVAVVGYYCYLVNRSNRSAQENTPTTVENVLLRDLENNYPPTPKEVIRYYNDIVKCFYNEGCSQEELQELARKARGLYDQELLDHNEWDTYIFNLEAEIQDFKNNNRKISNISLAASTDVDEFTQDGFRFAKIRCGYNILQGRKSSSTVQVYLLRRDGDGHWKIYGWDLAENLDGGKQPEGED
ncbi:hypothetical protein IMSAGC003_03128 [Lachnospiraceae bacterium]|jgi:hypothetical protein|nr:hypothetical protein [Lachnospiraceae bacterium]MCX4273738.1 hypothetical protein [Acetatifactor sp.]GFH96571.1 hypothetical protein IMSAGC003_03128 [Lachnospiraceae bacterium]